ncbi:MAG: TonB-dependent receptor [Halieaceae bacterium]|jgi:iron complex outermembrane receptor protein|nr:TonB-dependent receptor [Halieaceae bacterium]
MKSFAPRLLPLLLACPAALVRADHIEEVVVRGVHDTRTIEVSEALVVSPDTAQLLKKAPGANVNSNGPLSGIPQYRGMFGPRVGVLLDGVELAPAGPNWMDPPLSYAAAGQLESLELFRGIAPVSVVQESIGGAVRAVTAQQGFAERGEVTSTGHLYATGQTVNEGLQLGGSWLASTDSHRLRLAALTESGEDSEFPGGEILPSEYQRDRFDIAYGYRWGNHSIELDYVYSDTGNTGTAALPMDIDFIRGDLASLSYRFESGAWLLDARLFGSDLDHEMTNFHLRQAPAEGAAWRRNTTDSRNRGFKVAATHTHHDTEWVIGADGLDSTHNSDIDNPNNPAFFVVNFNDVQRRVLGVFVESRRQLAPGLRSELGLRYNRVDTDADQVDGTPAMMMPPAMALRDAFNSADRSKVDHNVDAVAKLWLDVSTELTWYAGLGRKTRSPSYQERYLWLPLQATGGLADGFNYTGDIELEPEVAHELEIGLDFNGARLALSPRLFYRDVEDFIQGVPGANSAAGMVSAMMGNPGPLQFANVDAVFWGFDMDWRLRLDERFQLRGLVNYVRGERDDIDDDLYRLAPFNTSLSLDYTGREWGASIEAILYADQDNVSETNGELETDGYELVNIAAWWDVSNALRLAAGVDNLLDEEYSDHLAGRNRAGGNPDLARGQPIPGLGANGYLRVDFRF